MANQTTPSRSEEYCRAHFEQWLRAREPKAAISWRYVSPNEQTDKPDFYLTIDARCYAVEVSTIVGRIDVAGKLLEESGVTAALWRVAKDAQRLAVQRGILSGCYVLDFHRPIPNLGRARHILIKQALSYIERTRDELGYPQEELLDSACDIRKVNLDKDVIYPVGPGDGGFGEQIRAEARDLLYEALQGNISKSWVEGCGLPVILLLLNSYPLAELEDFPDALSLDGLPANLCAVLVVGGERVLPVYLAESRWVGVAG